jgi:DNA-binding NtrC family response regulator
VFVQATGGTLFLDELGELPIEQQPHLLRALETRRVRRVGGTRRAALRRPGHRRHQPRGGLGTERGALRVDLYHRLATVLIRLPPLRARPADLDELAGAFLEELGREHGPRRLSAARAAPSARTSLAGQRPRAAPGGDCAR